MSTNYDVYFGTQERAQDSLSLLVDYRSGHNRQEVNEFVQEVVSTGASKWIKQECTNKRWWAGKR